jgi:diphthine-ammonia ligase
MNFIALVSGGKDSIYALSLLRDQGNNLKGILYIENKSKNIDSFMYQCVGSEVIDFYSECLGVPLFRHTTNAHSYNQELLYKETQGDEVEDLYLALKKCQQVVSFDAVSSGAILSTYQKNRVENVCNRLNLESLAPLWKKDQQILLKEMINYGIDARIVKIASPGFGKECINLSLTEMNEKIEKNINFGDLIYKYFNFCGEGGEFESIVCNAPGFKKRIKITEFTIERHPEEEEKEWNVFYMKIIKAKTVDQKN